MGSCLVLCQHGIRNGQAGSFLTARLGSLSKGNGVTEVVIPGGQCPQDILLPSSSPTYPSHPSSHARRTWQQCVQPMGQERQKPDPTQWKLGHSCSQGSWEKHFLLRGLLTLHHDSTGLEQALVEIPLSNGEGTNSRSCPSKHHHGQRLLLHHLMEFKLTSATLQILYKKSWPRPVLNPKKVDSRYFGSVRNCTEKK